MLFGTQVKNSLGHLEIGGCDTVELAKEFGTPLYVMDEHAIRLAMQGYHQAFASRYKRVKFYFASKAFLSLAIARIVLEEDFCMDVASAGELYVALQAGFPPAKLALHGNNKSDMELQMAVDSEIGHIILDNFFEIEQLSAILKASGKKIGVLVRATPGVDPQTHRLIRTGQADTKFGFNIKDGSALKAVKTVLQNPHMIFQGIHCHVGSQLLESDTHYQAVQIMVQLLQSIHEVTGSQVDILNIGGGLGVRYIAGQNPPSYDAFAETIVTALNSAFKDEDMRPELHLEPGRSIVGEAGTTLYTIGAVKTVPTDEHGSTRTYASVDGGLSDNPRPQLYEALYSCIMANRMDDAEDRMIAVAGKHCETDILIQETQLPLPVAGDLLAVQTTGAYNFVMASNYNRFLRPAVVLVNDGTADVIVKRQTLEDLISGEVIPARLK